VGADECSAHRRLYGEFGRASKREMGCVPRDRSSG
jgi:hypothetical protein